MSSAVADSGKRLSVIRNRLSVISYRLSVIRIWFVLLLFTVHRLPFTVHQLPFTVHRSPFTNYRSPFTVHRSPFTVHRLPFTVYGLLITVFLTSCASVQPVVKIGLVAPFEGAQRELGYDAIYAARLAVREVNQAGGIGGYRVALVALDDGGDEQMAAETAASLTIDPAVIAVIGHGLAETTAAAQPIYAAASLPLLPLGHAPFVTQNPVLLPAEFINAYNAVTPFDETAGPYAAATYDAMQLIFKAMAGAETAVGKMNRDSVTNAMAGLQYDGLVGTVYQP